VAEGDTVRRLAHRIDAALTGRRVQVSAPNTRARTVGLDRLDRSTLEESRAIGKNLLLDFGGLVLHSHLGMHGSWHVYAHGERWRRPEGEAWAVLRGGRAEVVQWGGPTLRVLSRSQLRCDPMLRRLGPDILGPEREACVASLRGAAPARALGEALLDQSLVAGIGNIFKSEGCFAARLNPWRPLSELAGEELRRVVETTSALMQDAVRSGRQPRSVYRRAARPCPVCGRPIRSRGQGDANRVTYWCVSCQE
jgi:endonuclease-8